VKLSKSSCVCRRDQRCLGFGQVGTIPEKRSGRERIAISRTVETIVSLMPASSPRSHLLHQVGPLVLPTRTAVVFDRLAEL